MVTRSEITAAMDQWVSARHKGAVSARYKGAVSAFPGRRTRMMMPMSDVIVQHTPPAHGRPARWSVNALIRPERGVAAERSVEAHFPPRVPMGQWLAGGMWKWRRTPEKVPHLHLRGRTKPAAGGVAPPQPSQLLFEHVEDDDGLRSVEGQSGGAGWRWGWNPGPEP